MQARTVEGTFSLVVVTRSLAPIGPSPRPLAIDAVPRHAAGSGLDDREDDEKPLSRAESRGEERFRPRRRIARRVRGRRVTTRRGTLWRARGAVCALAMSMAWPSSGAEPGGRTEAGPHFQRGAQAYAIGHFDEAIAEFETAYKLDPAPILLFNIAQANRHLGRKERALFFYRRYLEQAPAAPNRADAQRHVTELEDEIKREGGPRAPVGDTGDAPSRQPLPAQLSDAGPQEHGPLLRGAVPPRWQAAFYVAPTLLGFGRDDIEAPLNTTFSLTAAHLWPVGAVHLQLGGALQVLPLPFIRLDGVSRGTSWLWGGLAWGGAKMPLSSHWSVAARLGLGVLWWSGLSKNNPFTDLGGASSGPVPLPTAMLSAEVAYAFDNGLFVALAPSFVFSKTTSPGLTSDISHVSAGLLGLGLGTTF